MNKYYTILYLLLWYKIQMSLCEELSQTFMFHDLILFSLLVDQNERNI